MSGSCTDCGRDGALWRPADSAPQVDPATHGEPLPRALCAACREEQDDGESPWRSA